jgi:GNAT superfamily N-acetyltransferase
MDIRRYTKEDAEPLMELIQAEGEDWACYSAPGAASKYIRMLGDSITHVAEEGGRLLGYARSIADGSLYIFICDLLVDKRSRGRGIGRALMERVCADYPDHTVYVMSGADEYYAKQGYIREGSIFRVVRPAPPS